MSSIRNALADAPSGARRFLRGATADVCLGDIVHGTSLSGRLADLADRSVLLATRDPLAAALALIELDGVVRRLIVCPPDVRAEHWPLLVDKGGVDAIVSDYDLDERQPLNVGVRMRCGVALGPAPGRRPDGRATEWVLLTSGTTGAPKMVAHTFAGLTGAIRTGEHDAADVVWGTFYDIRRYGGLQIFLRALLGTGSFVFTGAEEPTADFLVRLGVHGVTHLSGTPSHWRRALMSPAIRALSPRYVRLSGEIADQAILNALRLLYPQAAVGHAFASTEAGVGFEVTDGLEGFPASVLGARGNAEVRVESGSLRIRSARTAVGFVGETDARVDDADGFVDTGDMVERRGDRYYFLGRKSGVINIGGLKVYPEEVEAVINSHPAVRMSIVEPRKSPITGALVAAQVVLHAESSQGGAQASVADVKREILEICHDSLAAHKVPVAIRFVAALDVSAAGKVARARA